MPLLPGGQWPQGRGAEWTASVGHLLLGSPLETSTYVGKHQEAAQQGKRMGPRAGQHGRRGGHSGTGLRGLPGGGSRNVCWRAGERCALPGHLRVLGVSVSLGQKQQLPGRHVGRWAPLPALGQMAESPRPCEALQAELAGQGAGLPGNEGGDRAGGVGPRALRETPCPAVGPVLSWW